MLRYSATAFSLFVALSLAASPPALAQTGAGLELGQDQIQQFMQSCLEGTGGDQTSDSSQARKCTQDYYSLCADGGGYTGEAQRQCWGALETYWAAVVQRKGQEIEGAAPANLKRYVADFARAEEAYRKERCKFWEYLSGPWTGPGFARCQVDTLIDRAVDLEVIQQNMPR